ncbi:MAG TPA: VanZ family protein [Pedococcus sp.]|nr:VanZ family protein [Pedococcus sp.]
MTTPGRTTAPRGSTEAAPRRRTRRAWRVAFVGLVVVQLLAVYWPRVDVQGPVTWTDKVVHVLLFLLPTVAGLVAGLRPSWVVGLIALHAPVSELVQHFVLPNRSGDVWDAVADLSGVVLGVTLVVVGRARRRW